MGGKWEVAKWVNGGHLRGFDYTTVYTGNSLIKAIYYAVKAKRDCGCVKFYWRG